MSVRFTAALIDLSGTLHVEDSVLPGAVEALRRYAVTIYAMQNMFQTLAFICFCA